MGSCSVGEWQCGGVAVPPGGFFTSTTKAAGQLKLIVVADRGTLKLAEHAKYCWF